MKSQKIFLTVIALLLFTGIICAQNNRKQPAPWDNGPLKVSENRRFLQHKNGKPFFWLGETAWLLTQRLNREEAGFYIGEVAKNGYNVIQTSVLHSLGAMNVYGHIARPNGFDFSGIDSDGEYNYWKHVDYIVETAATRGIYIAIVCVWGGNARNMSVEDAKKYGEFLGKRYSKYPNIIWLIGGDIRGDATPDVFGALANTIRSYTPDHLMTFHPFGRTMSATWFHNESWLDLNMFQSGHRRYGQRRGDGEYTIDDYTEEDSWRFVERSLAFQPPKPVLDGEPSYEHIPQGLHDPNEPRWQGHDVRRYAYWSVFAGSCGHTYGHSSLMQMYRPGYSPAYGATVPWWDALKAPGFLSMKHLKALITAFPYFDRIPDQSVISANNGTHYERAIATRGNDYMLIYNYTNRRVEIDMTKISGAKKKAWWYSPVTGQAEYIGDFANVKQNFNRDSAYGAGNDWVLIITDARVNYVENNLLTKWTESIHAQERRVNPNVPWNNGKLQVSENRRFLQHENGKPFFWLGETAWLLPSRLNREEVGYYLGQTAKKEYNVVQISVLHTLDMANVYGHFALPGGFDFTGIDRDGKYNYWKHVDYIVEQAALRGIYIAIVCAWGDVLKSGMSVEDAQKYGEFLANRYKNHPNIIWLIGGDIRGDIVPEIHQTLANSIRHIASDHLMTFHPFGRTMSGAWFHNESWLDFNMFQSGHRRYGQRRGDGEYTIDDYTEEDSWRFVERSLAFKPLKPVIDGEPSYEDIPMGLHDTSEPRWQAHDVRRYAYWSVFAGSFGHTYGHNSTMQMIRSGLEPSFGAEKPWWEAIHDPGCQQMRHLKKLILTFPFFERIPDQSVITGVNGTQYERVIATRGNDYMLIYNYTNRRMEIDMTKISGAKKKAWWYSPFTGQAEYIGEFANGKQTFNHDSAYSPGNDWVLIITDAQVNYVENNLITK